jgi:hypothetical protein
LGYLPPVAGSTCCSGVADGTLVAHGQLMAPLGAAAGQDCPAILGLHTGAKAVFLGAFTIVRLKCTFWHRAQGGSAPRWRVSVIRI